MMHPRRLPVAASLLLVLALFTAAANAQAGASRRVRLTILDENEVVVADARVTIVQLGQRPIELLTSPAGRAEFSLSALAPYRLQVDKPGFYEALKQDVDPQLHDIELILQHQQIVSQEVSVVASTPNIDPQQTADVSTMNTPEIVNIPYVTNRNIVNLLPYNPGVIRDPTGQIHVAGSPAYATLDLLDGFDLRSPVSGILSLHVSTDAVRSIVTESTRYPVEFGKASGGVIAFSSGMGDNRYRFNATDFLPSYIEKNGIHFDKFIPRVTFSGPIAKNKAWYFDGFDLAYASNYIVGLPANADTDPSWQESNLSRFQFNLTPRNNLIAALLFNDSYSPYSGLSTLTPRTSTVKRDTLAWLPYLRDQQLFANGTLLDLGIGITRIHSGYEPHGDTPYQLTPETAEGSYFENLTGRSSRIQESFALYLSPRHWIGEHALKAGVDLDQITFGESFFRAPINYLREDGTLLRQSTFPTQPSFTRQNADVGAYVQDHWQPAPGLSIDPGLRFDWDQIIRRPLYSPRIAAVFAPGKVPTTKISAGIGVYYEHTQLDYLQQAFAGLRNDTYYAADGVTPISPPLPTVFTVDYPLLRAPRVINGSAAIEQKLPAATYASLSYIDKRGSNFFVFADQSAPSLSGTYLLTNQRHLDYHAVNLTLRHNFSEDYVLFAAYTHSLAHTNAALDYSPTDGYLGLQQPGPLPWNVPNRVISWGWLPVPKLKRWDFVYTLDWRTGLPFTAIHASHVVVGAPDSHTYPSYFSFSPGLEWRFHLRGAYFGLRVIISNATDRQNPTVVNNVVDSPEYGTFSEPLGRAITARIRLIGNK
ncbi:MAG TPA: TonB-dependent receptor [Granulicella sp.]|nr:TonB-dependent receptor [Granulicella sp.]